MNRSEHYTMYKLYTGAKEHGEMKYPKGTSKQWELALKIEKATAKIVNSITENEDMNKVIKSIIDFQQKYEATAPDEYYFEETLSTILVYFHTKHKDGLIRPGKY